MKINKWLIRLVEKITLNTQSTNDSFTYYGYKVDIQSNTRDYIQVYVSKNRETILSFNFDFWTKRLNVENHNNDYNLFFDLIEGFYKVYGLNLKY